MSDEALAAVAAAIATAIVRELAAVLERRRRRRGELRTRATDHVEEYSVRDRRPNGNGTA